VRAVVGDDEPLLLEGVRAILVAGGIDVVATAERADHLITAAAAHRPDIVIADIRMPPGGLDDGLQAALEIRRTMPQTAVLLLSQHASSTYARELLGTGPAGVGYLLKQRIANAERFVADVRRIAAGGTVFDQEIAAAAVARAARGVGPLAALTARQLEVLELVAQGRSNTAIALQLGITEKAVTRHTSTIYNALSIRADDDGHRRVLAVLRYLDHAGA
jgi:DNA-binding NarL/FixJ family response regulator